MLQSQNSSRPSGIANRSRYRVMLLRANGKIALVYMSPNRVRAVRVARKAIKNHLARLEKDWRRIIKSDDRPKIGLYRAVAGRRHFWILGIAAPR